MIPLPAGVRVWLATGYTDMRKGFPSLALQVQEILHRDPLGGHLFCFRGRRGNLRSKGIFGPMSATTGRMAAGAAGRALLRLARSTGILQADAYSGYNELYDASRAQGPVTPALCWAHARQQFFELADTHGDADHDGKAQRRRSASLVGGRLGPYRQHPARSAQ
jgi:hypothetical protein